MTDAVRRHWREYLFEAFGLGAFMVSACVFSTVLEHPASPVRSMIPNALLRHALIGIAMGSTAIAIIHSPWGKRSGALLNPALDLTFYRLGKLPAWDAALFAASQFIGGALGVVVARLFIGDLLIDPAVHFAVTMPGMRGIAIAFGAEAVISMLLVLMVLFTAATPRLAPYTGVFAGIMVATCITLEAPISGMSMNPARSLASALAAGSYMSLWIYFIAPPLGMLAAAQIFLAVRGRMTVPCAKYCHVEGMACISCEYEAVKAGRRAAAGESPGRDGGHTAGGEDFALIA